MTAALAVGLILGYLIGAVELRAHHRAAAQIAEDTRAAFVDDEADTAIDDDTAAASLS